MSTPPRLPPAASVPPRAMGGPATAAAKLRGEVYTPLEGALGMVRRLRWPAGGPSLLDPSCGEGVFLEAAMRRLHELGLEPEDSRAVLERVQGWDAHAPALEACRARLVAVSRELGFGGAVPTLVHRDALADDGERFHAVLGNPPYLEAKRMPAALKAHVKACCPTAARGAFDLNGACVARGLAALEPGGELCFIIPNRFLVTAYAQRLRQVLLDSAAVTVLDLSRSRVFADAAVYPVVLLARRDAQAAYRVEPWDDEGAGVALPVETLRGPLGSLMPLPPTSPGGRRLFARSLGGAPFEPLGAVFDIRWCVSFHKAGLRERFVTPERPESPHARPFLGGGRWQGNRAVEPYRLAWDGWWIDYDMERARSLGNPLPPPEIHAPPKVVICQNARRARAALDREGLVLKDTFLSLRCREPGPDQEAALAWVVLVLNSRLFHYLYEHLYGGTRKGGAYLHFLGRYLDPCPVPPLPCPEGVRALHAALEAGEGSPEEAEAMVREAWGVTPSEARALDAYDYPDP